MDTEDSASQRFVLKFLSQDCVCFPSCCASVAHFPALFLPQYTEEYQSALGAMKECKRNARSDAATERKLLADFQSEVQGV